MTFGHTNTSKRHAYGTKLIAYLPKSVEWIGSIDQSGRNSDNDGVSSFDSTKRMLIVEVRQITQTIAPNWQLFSGGSIGPSREGEGGGGDGAPPKKNFGK